MNKQTKTERTEIVQLAPAVNQTLPFVINYTNEHASSTDQDSCWLLGENLLQNPSYRNCSFASSAHLVKKNHNKHLSFAL